MCDTNHEPIGQDTHDLAAEHAIDREFLLAGRAIVTVANGHGCWQTFLIEKCDGEGDYAGTTTYFVRLFRGGDNTDAKCYRYVGILRPETGYLKFTAASPANFLSSDAGHAWRFLGDCLWGRRSLADDFPASIRHMGFCCACGLPLTSEESLRTGWGPVCRGKANKAKKAWLAEASNRVTA